MANSATVDRVEQGNKQFQGAFSEMWAVTATITDQDAVAIGDTMSISLTVPGVALGDMVIGTSLSKDTFDGDGDGAVIRCEVGSANTVNFMVHADVAEFAADAILNAVVKILVGRPAW
jgi:hypothetical protein